METDLIPPEKIELALKLLPAKFLNSDESGIPIKMLKIS